jgi:hypothetical protein
MWLRARPRGLAMFTSARERAPLRIVPALVHLARLRRPRQCPGELHQRRAGVVAQEERRAEEEGEADRNQGLITRVVSGCVMVVRISNARPFFCWCALTGASVPLPLEQIQEPVLIQFVKVPPVEFLFEHERLGAVLFGFTKEPLDTVHDVPGHFIGCR